MHDSGQRMKLALIQRKLLEGVLKKVNNEGAMESEVDHSLTVDLKYGLGLRSTEARVKQILCRSNRVKDLHYPRACNGLICAEFVHFSLPRYTYHH